jgi:hypothetical protein
VKLGGGDVSDQGLGRCLGVVGSGIDHLQCGAFRLEIAGGHGLSLPLGWSWTRALPPQKSAIVEARLAAVVEGSDSFDAVGADSRAPVGVKRLDSILNTPAITYGDRLNLN